MLSIPRPYHDEPDLARMAALLQSGRAAGIPSYYVHPGDLKWWLYYPPLGASYWEHIYLWDDPEKADRLLGWALLGPWGGGDTFDVYCQPDLYGSEVMADMLAWAEEALEKDARRLGCKQMNMYWVIPEDSFRIRWLEERGYRAAEQDAALARSLDKPIPEAGLPEGFQVRSGRGLAEVEARALAQYGAFGSTAPLDAYVERFARFMQSPVYSPAADIVAAASDGRVASFCIIWTDEVNKVGLFEPVGTHPDFQKKGLGKAVLREGLRRLRAQGMERAIVITPEDNAPALRLYESVGFSRYSAFRVYEKELD